MVLRVHRRSLLAAGAAGSAAFALAGRLAYADDIVADAKANVAKYTARQTTWNGPTTGPKTEPGKHVVFIPYDASNDASREWGTTMGEAAKRIGWKVTVINGRGTPEVWLEAFNQAIALKPDGIVTSADAASLQAPIAAANSRGIVVLGIHGTAFAGPQPKAGLFYNIEQDAAAIGRAQADFVIAHSDGKARVVVTTHGEFAVAFRKASATRDRLQECKTCTVLEFSNTPISEAAQRQPQLVTAWVQKYGTPLYITAVADYTLDFQVPALRAGNIDGSKVILVGADGQKSAYERIRAGNQYQLATVAEPYAEEGYQALDELNRAFHKMPGSGFVPPPYLVTPKNIDIEGGNHDTFDPSNNYAEIYAEIWGVSK